MNIEKLKTAMKKAIVLEKLVKSYHAGYADKMHVEFKFQQVFGLEKGNLLLANYPGVNQLIDIMSEKQLESFINQF